MVETHLHVGRVSSLLPVGSRGYSNLLLCYEVAYIVDGVYLQVGIFYGVIDNLVVQQALCIAYRTVCYRGVGNALFCHFYSRNKFIVNILIFSMRTEAGTERRQSCTRIVNGSLQARRKCSASHVCLVESEHRAERHIAADNRTVVQSLDICHAHIGILDNEKATSYHLKFEIAVLKLLECNVCRLVLVRCPEDFTWVSRSGLCYVAVHIQILDLVCILLALNGNKREDAERRGGSRCKAGSLEKAAAGMGTAVCVVFPLGAMAFENEKGIGIRKFVGRCNLLYCQILLGAGHIVGSRSESHERGKVRCRHGMRAPSHRERTHGSLELQFDIVVVAVETAL